MRYVVYGLLLLLYVLHTDVWYWNDARMVLGLPIGVTYHVMWTLTVSGAFWLTVRYAWPAELESGVEGPLNDGAGRLGDVAGRLGDVAGRLGDVADRLDDGAGRR